MRGGGAHQPIVAGRDGHLRDRLRVSTACVLQVAALCTPDLHVHVIRACEDPRACSVEAAAIDCIAVADDGTQRTQIAVVQLLRFAAIYLHPDARAQPPNGKPHTALACGKARYPAAAAVHGASPHGHIRRRGNGLAVEGGP